MRVFLCEKPSQGKDIAPHVGATQSGRGFITGPGVAVTWCIGHLLEQAKPEHYNPDLKSWNLALLPVCPTQWHMEVKASTADQYKAVVAVLKQATEVVIATDADREGEVIARSVLDRVGYRGPIRRLWLGALDSASVKKALAGLLPNEKTLPMYFSGMGRARADWLTGMNMTMSLTSAFGAGGRGGVMHCGRVQTPTLALIVRRERAIVGFVPKTHFQLAVSFEMRGTVVPMDWRCPFDRLDANKHCLDKAYVDSVANAVRGKLGYLTKVVTTPERELAPLPYSLGSLQQDASARYGLKVQAVLDACQALYEKHKATTYPRTDCEYLPVSMFADVPGVLKALVQVDGGLTKLAGLAAIAKPGRAFNDGKVTAHHAIVPTGNPSVRLNELSQTERLVYDLIRRRYLAQFLGDFLFNKTVLDVECAGHGFSKTGKMPTSLGWKRALEGLTQSASAAVGKSDAKVEVALPEVKLGDQALNCSAKTVPAKTEPPKRYTEGTLLAVLEAIDKVIDDPRLKKIMLTKEKAGIGTDATRASIVEGLFKRGYVANNKKFIVPTDNGNALIEVIEKMAPAMADPVLTAEWEDKLSQIQLGTLSLAAFEAQLVGWLKQVVENIRKQAVSRPAHAPVSGGVTGASSSGGGAVPALAGPVYLCEQCKKPMRQRSGTSGVFWGCTGYPVCKCTLPDENGKPVARHAAQSGGHAGQVRAPTPSSAAMPAAVASPVRVVDGMVGHRAPARLLSSAPLTMPTQAAVGMGTGIGAVAGAGCDKTCGCGKPMRLRNGARGAFYGCTGFPVCRHTEAA